MIIKLFSQIPKILTFKQKFLLIILFIFTGLMSIAELLGLGSLVVLISIITNPEVIIEKFNNYNINLSESLPFKGNLIKNACIILILIFSFKTIISFLFNYFSAKITASINHKISSSFFKRYIYKNYEILKKFSSTQFINDIKDETTRFITFLFAAINIIKDSFLVIIILSSLIVISSYTTIVLFITILVISTSMYLTLKKILRQIGDDRTRFNTKIYKILNETFYGIKNIKLIGVENFISKNFDRNLSNLLRNTLKIRLINPIPRIFLEWFSIISISLLIIYLNTITDNLPYYVPTLTFIALSLIRLVPAFAAINQNIGHLNWNLNSTKLIVKELSPKISFKIKNLNKLKINSIKLKNVSINYNEKVILENVNLTTKKNNIIGIVGPSGSGKTSLVELILGLKEPKKGNVYINNRKNITKSNNYKNSVSYVSQDIFLFEGTILENITFGAPEKKINIERLNSVISDSELDKLVNKHPKKLNYIISEAGKNFSGGEKQRLTIARALYRNSEIIVFDEATSSLDNLTEKKILTKLKKYKKDKTIFMITHKVKNLDICDKIYFVNNGKLKQISNKKNLQEANFIRKKNNN